MGGLSTSFSYFSQELSALLQNTNHEWLMYVAMRDQFSHLEGSLVLFFLNERSSIGVFPVFNLTFKSLNMMKPSPQSQGFIYEIKHHLPSLIRSNSHQGNQGRTGKAINCQSLHRSTSQFTTTIPVHPHQPLPTDTHFISSYCTVHMRTDTNTRIDIH